MKRKETRVSSMEPGENTSLGEVEAGSLEGQIICWIALICVVGCIAGRLIHALCC